MKFEDFLMQQPSEEINPKIKDLQQEVEKLHEELDGELQVKRVLQCALKGPVHSCTCSSLLLPTKVQMLLTELAMVEEEIIFLERKVDQLKLNLRQERKQNKEWEMLLFKEVHPTMGQWHWHKKILSSSSSNSKQTDYDGGGQHRKNRILQERRTSLGSSTDFETSSFRSSIDELVQSSRSSRSYRSHIQMETDIDIEKPNKLSEELIKCLIDIFIQLIQQPSSSSNEKKALPIVPKHRRSSSKTKGFISKSSFTSCTSPLFSWDENRTSNLDPYGILLDSDATVARDIGPYKNFIQITRTSIDTTTLLSESRPAMRRLRVLMYKLSDVDLTYLSYKQKLAFWINMYNACIMHALLQHGFPSAQEKVLAITNEAAINVGGIVLNALAIEHFILRHPLPQPPPETKDKGGNGAGAEKEMLVRHAYGLGYPEPNVTFALCKGTWSSPALRVYTPDEIVNELERAKVEYLEASIGVSSKKSIILPKLMELHMRDFADDMQSMVEWIYSQLPQSGGSLKRLLMECLNQNAGDDQRRRNSSSSSLANMIEIQNCSYEFRYIISIKSETRKGIGRNIISS